MNVLLIRPKPDKESIGLQTFMICEPLELEYIASTLESNNHNVAIADLIVDRKSLKWHLKKHKPQIVGLSGYINHVNIVKEIAQQVKEYDESIYTVVGGVQAEVVPTDFECGQIDFIVHVNGLETIKDVVDTISDSGSGLGSNLIDKQSLRRKIPGLWDGDQKEYVFKKNIDFPFPNRTLLSKYRKKYNYIFHSHCAILKTSYGCAFNCDFCFCVEITKHNFYERPLENVIEEIKTINEKNIFIVDDNFLFNPKRVEQFCDLLVEHKINKNFILFGRTDFIVKNKALLERFSTLGLQAIFMGLESFTESELETMNKKVSVEQNVKALHILEELNIECHAGIIVPPHWQRKDFNTLIQWLKKFKMVFVNIQPLTPMPGTPVYKKYTDKIIIPRNEYAKWDMAHLVVRPEHMSIRKFYKNILRAYYKTSAGFGAHLYILKKYGFKTYIRTAIGSMYITMQYIFMYLRG